MSTADAAWLRMDRPTNLMIVNSVLWFDEPVDWERCKAVFLNRIVARFDRFRQRASEGRRSRTSSATASPRRSITPARCGRST